MLHVARLAVDSWRMAARRPRARSPFFTIGTLCGLHSRQPARRCFARLHLWCAIASWCHADDLQARVRIAVPCPVAAVWLFALSAGWTCGGWSRRDRFVVLVLASGDDAAELNHEAGRYGGRGAHTGRPSSRPPSIMR